MVNVFAKFAHVAKISVLHNKLKWINHILKQQIRRIINNGKCRKGKNFHILLLKLNLVMDPFRPLTIKTSFNMNNKQNKKKLFH